MNSMVTDNYNTHTHYAGNVTRNCDVPCTIFTWCTLKRFCIYPTTNRSQNRTAGLVILQAG